MPIDAATFESLGINNFALPTNAGRLDPYNDNAVDEFRKTTLINDIERVDNTNITNFYDPSGNEIFIPHKPATPDDPVGVSSYIKIGPVGAKINYYIRDHIANGAHGSICKVSTSPEAAVGEELRILKLQKISYNPPTSTTPAYYDWNRFFELVKEAVINKCLVEIDSNNYNIIYKIGMAPIPAIGRSIRIYYLLERLEETLETKIQKLGDPGVFGVATQIGDITKDALCNVNNILYSLHDGYQGTHGDLHTRNVMFYTNADGVEKLKLIDFGFTRLVYDTAILECNTYYNHRSSASRDLTILIFYLWHYGLGWTCSIKVQLKAFLEWVNPDLVTFSTFQNWSTRNAAGEPYFFMTVRPASNLARRATEEVAAKAITGIPIGDTDYYEDQAVGAVTLHSVPPVGLAELYLYFNVFDNPKVTYATVNAGLACPAPLGAPAPGEGGSRRKRDRPTNRKGRYTRKDAKKHRVPHKRHGQRSRRTQRASSSLH